MKVEENNEEVKQEEVKEEEPAGQNEERGEGQPDGPSDPPQNEANSPQWDAYPDISDRRKRTKTVSLLIAVSALFEGLKILIILKQSKK